MARRSYKAWLISLLWALRSLDGTVDLTILIHHKGVDPQLEWPKLYYAMAINKRACDKESGAIGHAWLWIHGIDAQGNHWDIECGHTGETDEKAPKYLELLGQRAYEAAQGKLDSDAIDVLWQDRWDGALEQGSGGHIPDVAWSLTLDEDQLQRLWDWICTDKYQIKRYNLADHHCCHFIIQALEEIGIYVSVGETWKPPKEFFLAGKRYCLYQSADCREVTFSTPWTLAQALSVQVPQLRPSVCEYMRAKHPQSPWPWKRFWQRLCFLKQMISGAQKQLEREWVARNLSLSSSDKPYDVKKD